MTAALMKDIDIRNVSACDLADRGSVRVDKTLPRRDRLVQYIRQIKNPYCYRDGDVVVKVSFKDTEETIEDRLEAYIRSL